MPTQTVQRTSLKSKTEEEIRAHKAKLQADRRRKEKLDRLAALQEQREIQASRLATSYMMERQTRALKENERAVKNHMDSVLTDTATGSRGLATLLSNAVLDVATSAIEAVQYSVMPPTPDRSAPSTQRSETAQLTEHDFVDNAPALMPGDEEAAESTAIVPRAAAPAPATPASAVATILGQVHI